MKNTPEARKAYYEKNKEKLKATAKKWREDNPEGFKALQKKHKAKYAKNYKPIDPEYHKKYYMANKYKNYLKMKERLKSVAA